MKRKDRNSINNPNELRRAVRDKIPQKDLMCHNYTLKDWILDESN